MATLMVEKLRGVRDGVFKEVQDKIQQVNNIAINFGYTNLKIYDVSHYLYLAVNSGLITDKQGNDLFNHISEVEYQNFQEWEEEHLTNINRSYIFSTSSFFYNTDWYGVHINTDMVEDTLKGSKDNPLGEALKELNHTIYNCLVTKEISDKEAIKDLVSYYVGYFNYDDVEEAEEDVLDELDEAEVFLEELSDDLDELLEVVNEAKLAYDYLESYKTQENEYYIAKYYLEHDIENYYAEDKADNLFAKVLESIAPINKVEFINFSMSKQDNEYVLDVETNNKSFKLDTGVSTEHELSKLYAECILHFIEENKKSYFIF